MHEELEAISEENRMASPHQSELLNQIHKELQIFFDVLYSITFSAKTNRFVLQVKAIKKIAAQLVTILHGNQQPPLIIQDHAELRKIILANTQSYLKNFYGPVDIKEDIIIISLYAAPHKTNHIKPGNVLRNFVQDIMNALPEYQSYLKLIEQINICQSLIKDLKQYEANLTNALKFIKANINNKQQSLDSIEIYTGNVRNIREIYNKIFEITDQIEHFIDNATRFLSQATSTEFSKMLKKIIHTADKEILESCTKLSQALTVKLNDFKELSRFNHEKRVKSLSRLMNEFNNLLSEELNQLENATPDHDHSDSQLANSSEEDISSTDTPIPVLEDNSTADIIAEEETPTEPDLSKCDQIKSSEDNKNPATPIPAKAANVAQTTTEITFPKQALSDHQSNKKNKKAARHALTNSSTHASHNGYHRPRRRRKNKSDFDEITSGISMPFMLFPPIESTAAMDADRKKFLELAQNDEIVTNSHSKRSLMLFPPAASDDSLKARIPLHKATQKNRVDTKPPTHHAIIPIQPTSNLYRK